MVVTYCTAAHVASLLNKIDTEDDSRFTYSSSTFPTDTEIEQFINDAEDEIDEFINHSYRSTSVGNPPEYHTVERVSFIHPLTWIQGVLAIPVSLVNRNITTPVSGTDLFEFFNGTSWEDLVASYTKGEGVSDGDWWLDEEFGIVWLYAVFPTIGRRNFRATYRFGAAATVPNDIRRACAELAAATVIDADIYTRHFPDNVSRRTFQGWADKHEKRAYQRLDKRREFQIHFN